jgi:hypothetical protein
MCMTHKLLNGAEQWARPWMMIQGYRRGVDVATREDILNLAHWPARLTSEEAGWALGFASHDIPILVKAKLLKPLGSPTPNAPKYFSAVDVEGLAKDTAWLSKATKKVSEHWKSKNQKPCAKMALTAA